MPQVQDGPGSPLFRPLDLGGTVSFSRIGEYGFSEELTAAIQRAPFGECIGWGIPFRINGAVPISSGITNLEINLFRARWLVFQHTSDSRPLEKNEHGLYSPMRGTGVLNESAAIYTVEFEDGSEEKIEIRRRYRIGAFQRMWGENCFEAVSHEKPKPIRAHHEQTTVDWGISQTRADSNDSGMWINWLTAWENPRPGTGITGIKVEPVAGKSILFAVSYGSPESNPLKWISREKAIVKADYDPHLDERGLTSTLRIDLGQIISVERKKLYPNDRWSDGYNNQQPEYSDDHVLIEYTAHPDAKLYVNDVAVVPLGKPRIAELVCPVSTATKRVTIRVTEKGSTVPIPVKLHVHGEHGEYLPPLDRHRIPNHAWYEDYSTDFVHMPARDAIGENDLSLAPHFCTYIPGETDLLLPEGTIYIEVSKGYEITPVRTTANVTSGTDSIEIEVERLLPWRSRGWVSADTHVHFLSPTTALLEGAAEGVNLVNLLASQWGELMTNVGDFDGKNTWGSKEAGGDGEYLVRVGTENRQHVLGHISLLGYEGRMIVPMTTGGPAESAIGDPIAVLLIEWARQCKDQNGVVILPHFPGPRAENAASILDGSVDGVEMTSWGDHYSGINPYSLSDWYRYLNCGYPVAAVGGTDKMSASTAVGTVRTYAKLRKDELFGLEAWKNAVRRMETFVTYGPLLELNVDGTPIGGTIEMNRSGGNAEVVWEAETCSVPISRVDLVVNGEIVESQRIDDPGRKAAGSWRRSIIRSSWVALMVRGSVPGKTEMIAAHSSPVFVKVEGSEFYSEVDALTILEQIEGAMAYVDTVGTRAETAAYKRMRSVLESIHRKLHNRMHELGHFHDHTPADDHPEHR